MQRRVIVVGDSISTGTGLSNQAQVWHHGLVTTGDYAALCHNLSAPGGMLGGLPVGQIVFPGMESVVPALGVIHGVLGMGNGAVIIMLGGNNYLNNRPLATIAEGLNPLLDAAVPLPTIKFCAVVTPLWCVNDPTSQPNTLGFTMEQYRQAIRDVCAARPDPKLRLIEGMSVLDGTGHPEYFTDGWHPSVVGHQMLSFWMWAKTRAWLT